KKSLLRLKSTSGYSFTPRRKVIVRGIGQLSNSDKIHLMVSFIGRISKRRSGIIRLFGLVVIYNEGYFHVLYLSVWIGKNASPILISNMYLILIYNNLNTLHMFSDFNSHTQ